jgi:hypothetical protein
MHTVSKLRQQAIETITDYRNQNRSDLLKAIFDLRHDARSDDKSLLYPLLEHSDDGVVASALYSLFEVYNEKSELLPLIQKLAWGDSRDCGEMPIQSMAILILSRLAKSNPQIIDQLREIAEDLSIGECPRKDAWQALAGLYGVEWFRSNSTEMIMHPESEASEAIRKRIRVAMQ